MPITRASTRMSKPPNTTNTNPLMLDKEGFNWGPWTIIERRVIYEYLNSWISEHGLDAFASKPWARDELEFLADTINEVNAVLGGGAAPRSVLALQRQIRQLHGGRLGPLAKLARRSEALKFKLESESESGSVVFDDERFPEMAIPVPAFVDGMYTIGDRNVDPVSAVEGKTYAVKEESKEAHEEVGSEIDALEIPKAQEQKKEQVVKLSVDWERLHVGKDGKMVVLEEGEVWEGSPTA
ncbi:hypothetical protein EKO04_001569 [Ascochyta lentis]|uniref:Uncharacterized protein n=1 Tax=Ascochyta lentis TaxID=205686 RepID=A0A8H7JC00_9PLEO|nr:hypothetical protein EKO04_001569 [Ascochyta lentis]